MEDVGDRKEVAGSRYQVPGFVHVLRCLGIILVWYSSLTTAFLWLLP